MRQHQDPDDHDEDLDRHEEEEEEEEEEEDLEELGTPVYQGTGLSVRALTAEELQRFLEAHQGQPAELLGSGWTALDLPRDPLGVSQTRLGAGREPAGPQPSVAAEPPSGSLGSPGRSALVAWRLRFRPSEQARTWQRGAHGERRTARLLDRLTRDGYVVFHDLAVPGSQVHGGGLHAQGVAIVPAHLLRGALGYDRVLSDAEVDLLATTAWTSLRPAA